MAISIGTPGSTEYGGNPTTLAYNNAGDVLIAMVHGRNSAANTPNLITCTYNGVGMTARAAAVRTWVATKLFELESPATGSRTLNPTAGNCTYSAWGAVGLIGAILAGPNVDSDQATGFGTNITLAGALSTVPGGIIIAVHGRGHAVDMGVPVGWNLLWGQYGTEGGCHISYKLTNGTPLNPVSTMSSNAEWALAVASYAPPSVSRQAPRWFF